ncbi:Hypothetical protein BFG00_0022 [Corynebacterium pseudotuberculosis]|nr:Hypothetical protein BFF96_0023 [Corynebacterium pseudotuberculosis]AUY59410.1 Hypothetical protein BFG00_0022 [Corynebacterium pseudotuberculosis]VTQ73476.1 Uncharacterised protein [Corynebacterium pseudotuberculosis]
MGSVVLGDDDGGTDVLVVVGGTGGISGSSGSSWQ